MKYLALTSLVLVGAAHCDRRADPVTLHEVTVTGDRNLADQPAADNTGTNDRDRSATTLTAGEQPMREADATVVRDVRRAVMAEDGLSLNARNVKIIAIDGVVTLRGPVNSERERDVIGSLAARQPNVTRVENALEVAAK
jgi:osmotically-inducible protein OsmY